jgi:HPt (histidine-containing phosphotransfer) domain-containing protein
MSIQDVLAGLQKTYLASMPDKIALIETLFRDRDLEKLETEYHKLKGTGRTYGLPEFTQLGALLERICEIDPASLSTAVPLSLSLLTRMRDARAQGEGSGLALENESDFQTLVKIVEAAG